MKELHFQSSVFRWGIGLVSGGVIAIIALTYLEGEVQQMALLIALFDIVTTPFMLKHAVR